MQVNCRTNLDLFNEKWPCSLPAVPRVGDRIESSIIRNNFQLRLRVCSVTWRHSKEGYFAVIELHMFQEEWSIADFYRWYAPLVGKSVSYFI